MRRERGVHYVSKSGQEQVSDFSIAVFEMTEVCEFYHLTVNYKNAALGLWGFFFLWASEQAPVYLLCLSLAM